MAKFRFTITVDHNKHSEIIEIDDSEFEGMDNDERDLHANVHYEEWVQGQMNERKRYIPNVDQSWVEIDSA